MTAGTRAAALGRADALFVALACGVVPLVSLLIAVHAFGAIAHANLAAYVASIVKWTALGGGALVLGRRGGMSWDELYLDPRGSFLVRRPASTCVVVILFIAVVNFGVLHRFTVTWNALGLPRAPVPYLVGGSDRSLRRVRLGTRLLRVVRGFPHGSQRARLRAPGARDRLALRRHPGAHVLRRAGLRGGLSQQGESEGDTH